MTYPPCAVHTCQLISSAPMCVMLQLSTTLVTATSSCARTSSVFPITLCVIMTGTAVTAPMSPRSVVSGFSLLILNWLFFLNVYTKSLTFL